MQPIQHFYPGQKSTAKRRFTTFWNYLRDAGLLKWQAGKLMVARFSGAVVKQSHSIQEGLIGTPFAKFPQAKSSSTNYGETIKFEVDARKREKANHVHWNLVTAKAEFLHNRGIQSFDNEHIDLYAEAKGDTIIYEMKSAEEENLLPQVRRAVSQLYEYRYVFSASTARLCIVTNSPISGSEAWLADYLVKDRLIAYEWTKDFKTFQCSEASKKLLADFAP